MRWLSGKEELYDNDSDRYQLENLAMASGSESLLRRLRKRMETLLVEADDAFLPGNAYADWFDEERNLIRTALGPVPAVK